MYSKERNKPPKRDAQHCTRLQTFEATGLCPTASDPLASSALVLPDPCDPRRFTVGKWGLVAADDDDAAAWVRALHDATACHRLARGGGGSAVDSWFAGGRASNRSGGVSAGGGGGGPLSAFLRPTAFQPKRRFSVAATALPPPPRVAGEDSAASGRGEDGAVGEALAAVLAEHEATRV
jgi:hypothetical protein